jgi:pheromone shutdown-related protein TraB
VELVDRDIRVTLSRTWRGLGLWSKLRLLFQILASMGQVEEIDAETVERMKRQDVLESALAEVGRSMPALRTILIDERDRYLSQKIRNAPGDKVVAVVGAGHVPGILRTWKEAVDTEALETMPPQRPWMRSLKWILPGLILALLVAGFFYGGSRTGSQMVLLWVLANGALAGIGALAALAHPFTVVSSVLAAPLTSLNPMIAAGWVSGLVEAFTRKPKVLDFENLPMDITTLKGFWRNKITRILLVVVFTNMGSAAGTFIALPLMVRAL